MTDLQADLHSPAAQAELKEIYSLRFAGAHVYRSSVWRILATDFFSKWIRPTDSVLDLGCGRGEFINKVVAARKFAMDLNPAARECLADGIHLFEQDSCGEWPLPAGSLDAVFTSNFFEHLPSKAALRATLRRAYRCLKPNGCLIAMGPNVKVISGPYWDFFDHYLPLTERSMAEAMRLEGFRIERAIPRFLPYTMSLGFHPPLWTVRLYLAMPFVWPIFGRQFLVVGRKI